MNWMENWDDEVGLWRQSGGGHTVAMRDLDVVHPGPQAANRLLTAAELDALHEIKPERVLAALRALQWTGDDAMRGCMRWYWEEEKPGDTNAAFFIGQSLIVLRKVFYDRLDAPCRALLDEILLDLSTWFGRAVAHAGYYYPNRYLGDVVCAWMLAEITGCAEADGPIADHLRKAGAAWRDEHWGWGEHLSDVYATVLLNELSILLMLAEKLPDDVRALYSDLAAELLAIEDAFDGGPRVPVLRSYAFSEAQTHVNFRDKIAPRTDPPESFGTVADLGGLMYGLGWHDAMPARQRRTRDVSIPCFGGATATARVEDDIRLGSVSRFPVMPSAEYATYGLSWQCFPVAFSRGESDWGFLQWEVVEDGVRRAHPAYSGSRAHAPKSLTDSVTPPVVGNTHTLQRGSALLALRIMRAIPKSWTSLTDRFRLIDPTAKVAETPDDGGAQLLLTYPERQVSIHHVALTDGEQPALSTASDGAVEWAVTSDLHDRRMIVHLWAISLDGSADTAPELTTATERIASRSDDERARELRWSWGDHDWHVAIDPLSDEPLVEIGHETP